MGGMENSFSHRKRKGVDVSQGLPQKRKGDVMRIHGVINTPPILGENAPSSSRQGTHVVCPLDFIIELVLQSSFSWPFPSCMLKFDISLSTSLSNTNILLVFHCIICINKYEMNDMKTNSYIWDSLHYNK